LTIEISDQFDEEKLAREETEVFMQKPGCRETEVRAFAGRDRATETKNRKTR
jgi:hypothetical protein